jgi:DtxR family Mn-dependent transcriptional regulator
LISGAAIGVGAAAEAGTARVVEGSSGIDDYCGVPTEPDDTGMVATSRDHGAGDRPGAPETPTVAGNITRAKKGTASVNDLIDTTEMYLRTIFELEEEGIVPLRARIAERLNQSGPTVSQTVARMQRDGLLVVSDDRHLELTDLGRDRAISVMRKHRLAERLLLDVIGLDWQDVHVEACRWEHVMSEQVEQRLIALLGHPQTSPYGNPIPGLDHLGEASGPVTETHRDLIGADVAAGRGGRYEVRRIIEIVQNQPRVMDRLHRGGVIPGAVLEFSVQGETLVVVDGATTTELAPDIAHGIHVRPAA